MKPRRGKTSPCSVCGEDVYRKPSHVGKAKYLTCSMVCSKAFRSRNQKTLVCFECKKEYKVSRSVEKWNAIRGHKKNFCSRSCQQAHFTGPNNMNWNGGEFTNDCGYVLVHDPTHPRPVAGSYVYKHRHVIEKKLGRVLADNEHVHHINHDRSDNRVENLEVMTPTEHAKHHYKLRHKNIRGQFTS